MIDPDIAVGQAARKLGRYDQAVEAFARAARRDDPPPLAARLEFEALREVDISRYLVGRLLRGLGRPTTDFHGFDAIEPALSAQAVAARLDACAAADAWHDGEGQGPRQLRAIDRLARGEAVSATDNTSTVQLALAQRAWRRGRPAEVQHCLAAADSSCEPSANAQTLRGHILCQQGHGEEAMSAFNLALLYLYDRGATQGAKLQVRYRGYLIVHYRAEFYAVPSELDPMLDESVEDARLLAHRVPRRLRVWLRRHLPDWLLQLLRRTVSRTMLLAEPRVDRLQHSPDLMKVLHAIDVVLKKRA